MLEQRRAKEKGFVTLKEAAEISGYTSDYVGQLIRAGKIKGEQVYSGVAWMTTPEELQQYLNTKGKGTTSKKDYSETGAKFASHIDQFSVELHVLFARFKTVFLFLMCVSAVLALGFIISDAQSYVGNTLPHVSFQSNPLDYD